MNLQRVVGRPYISKPVWQPPLIGLEDKSRLYLESVTACDRSQLLATASNQIKPGFSIIHEIF